MIGRNNACIGSVVSSTVDGSAVVYSSVSTRWLSGPCLTAPALPPRYGFRDIYIASLMLQVRKIRLLRCTALYPTALYRTTGPPIPILTSAEVGVYIRAIYSLDIAHTHIDSQYHHMLNYVLA